LLNDVIVPLYAIRNRRNGYKCSMIKTAMELCGLPGGRVRSPLIEMSPEDRADLDALLDKANLKPVAAAV
jgi:5-dehydro-4-deoxyglucarate dehydratase